MSKLTNVYVKDMRFWTDSAGFRAAGSVVFQLSIDDPLIVGPEIVVTAVATIDPKNSVGELEAILIKLAVTSLSSVAEGGPSDAISMLNADDRRPDDDD